MLVEGKGHSFDPSGMSIVSVVSQKVAHLVGEDLRDGGPPLGPAEEVGEKALAHLNPDSKR
jgi:hypothetical protein